MSQPPDRARIESALIDLDEDCRTYCDHEAEWHDPDCCPFKDDSTKALADFARWYLSTAQLAPATEGPCTWTGDSEGVYETSCGHAFVFTEGGGPGEDGIAYCCYCAKKIERVQQCGICKYELATNALDEWPMCAKCQAESAEEAAIGGPREGG